MTKIKQIIKTDRGTLVAELESGEFIARFNSMALIRCERAGKNFITKSEPFIGGIMMRTEEHFRWCVEHI